MKRQGLLAVLSILLASSCGGVDKAEIGSDTSGNSTGNDNGNENNGNDNGDDDDQGNGDGNGQGDDDPPPADATHYRWYPSLDLTQIPFHTSDGPWGERRPVEAPAPPVTNRSVTARTLKELQDAVLTPGTKVTLGANFDGIVVLQGDITDVDLIVPPEFRTVDMVIGSYSPPSKTTRLRIRGPKIGEHSGGLMGTLTFVAPTSDLIIDGVDMNGEDRQGGSLLWYFSAPIERAAIVNVRGIAVGAAVLGDEGINIVVAGCNIISSALPRGVYDQEEGWGLRFHARQVIVYDNRIEGTRYHKVRVHTATSETDLVHYSWINNNVFVDAHEGRILTAMGQPGATYEGFWAQHNVAYANSSCMGPDFSAGDYTHYARLTDNTFYGNIQPRKNVGDLIDQTSGDLFQPWQEPPAWGPPGDPNELPLPMIDSAKCQRPDCSPEDACPGPN